MSEAQNALLAAHTVDRPDADVCSCGDSLPDGIVPHVAALTGTDLAAARAALLASHDNVEVNAGMCGGCDTCGSDAAMAVCRICGEGYSPCPTYYAVREPLAGTLAQTEG